MTRREAVIDGIVIRVSARAERDGRVSTIINCPAFTLRSFHCDDPDVRADCAAAAAFAHDLEFDCDVSSLVSALKDAVESELRG